MAAAAAAAIVARGRSLTTGSTSSSCISRRRYLFSNIHSPILASKPPFSSYHQFYSTSSTTSLPPPSNITPALVFSEDYFVSKYKFSPQIASKLASALARMRKPQNADLFLSFLKQSGFSNAHLERIVRHYPRFLSLCPEKSVKPKLKIFHDLGFSADEVTEIIGRDFTILCCQPKRIIHSLDVYRRLFGSNENVIKLIKRRANLLYTDPEKTVLPNIQFLNQCGIQQEQINCCIYSYTTLFTISQETLRRCVHKVDEMGVDRTSKMFIYAVWAVRTMPDETLKLKLKSLQDLGFSEEDISRVFRSAPGVIAVSSRKLKEVKEVLLETGKYDMPCIIKNPTSLVRSVEKRYKPRLQVLKELERKGLIAQWPALSTLACMTDKSFIEKFVAPNINVVGEDFIAKIAASSKPERETALETKLR